jgi:prepilin peptidase CpaA
METTATQALIFMIVALPVSVWVAWSDMKTMKIRNTAVVTLAVGFAVLGLIALPFPDYLWRYAHLVVILLIGMALNAVRLMGAGDAKFAAAAAPFIALGDLGTLLTIYIVCFLAAWIGHRIASKTPAIRNLAPDWTSWTAGKRFPMGLALGSTLVVYLAMAIIRGPSV